MRVLGLFIVMLSLNSCASHADRVEVIRNTCDTTTSGEDEVILRVVLNQLILRDKKVASDPRVIVYTTTAEASRLSEPEYDPGRGFPTKLVQALICRNRSRPEI